jgi:uncharacterized protein YjiS (DUF1127 family)
MTTLTFANLTREVPWLAAIGRFFADLAAGIHEGREIETRYFALSRLSDAELAQRGLKREDIARVAVTGRAGC